MLRVIQAHNYHVVYGGMEVLFETTVDLLRRRGHEVLTIQRHNSKIRGVTRKMRAFGDGFYSRTAGAEMRAALRSFRPDLVHIHNVYPQLSPSILDACVEADVPVVMACQDYKLTCPTAQHLRKGQICERCTAGREYWCLLTNCRGDLLMSASYAVRSAVARVRHCFQKNVTVFASPTQFVKALLVRNGFPSERIILIPNFADVPESVSPPRRGNYIAFVGRIIREKGLDTLIDAAGLCHLPVRIAGDYHAMPELVNRAPSNVTFLGKLSREQLPGFYTDAHCLVVPSRCWDVSPVVAAEAMGYGVPVIASKMGGLPEIVEHECNGLLFNSADAPDLAEKMIRLWEDEKLHADLSAGARVKAVHEYSPAVYYSRLLQLYERAQTLAGRKSS